MLVDSPLSPRVATVAVDLNPATRQLVTGTEVYAREVGRRLPAAAPEMRWVFYASRPMAGLGVDLVVLPFARMWSQLRLPLEIAGRRPDLFFAPSHVIPFAMSARALTVVHDLAFERYPDAYKTAEREYLRITTKWAAQRCRLLVADSEATKRDLVELYGLPPERVRVVPLGGGEARATRGASPSRPAPGSAPATFRKLGIDGDYVLQVGRIEVRKNQTAALAAVERIPGLTLVVVGSERDRELATRLRASASCRVVGRQDDEVLEVLYANARAVVVPSLYEGFGLPVLEGMARGKVVAAGRVSSLPEVGGDSVVYFDDPGNPALIKAALDKALRDDDLRRRLSATGPTRAATFTWDRCAAGVASVIRELVA